MHFHTIDIGGINMNCCNNSTRSCNCHNKSNICSCGWYSVPSCGCSYINSFPQYTPIQPRPRLATGYFINQTSSVASQGVIPLSLSSITGNTQNISSGVNGALLQPGTYSVEYSTTGSSASGVTVGVNLNGITQPQLTQTTTTAATTSTNVAGNGVITITSPNTLLTLNNLGADTATFTNTNLVIKQLV